MPAIDVELVVFSIENGDLKIALEPDRARPGYRRLPWITWEGHEDFVAAIKRLADEIAPKRRMEPRFSSYFAMPHPRRGLAMTFYLCAEAEKIALEARGAALSGFAQPEDVSHVYLTILAEALDRLRGTLRTEPLAAFMLQESFTLTQLQEANEAVLGGAIDKRHFRNQIQDTGWFEETGEMSGGAHRPAKLYRLSRTSALVRRVA